MKLRRRPAPLLFLLLPTLALSIPSNTDNKQVARDAAALPLREYPPVPAVSEVPASLSGAKGKVGTEDAPVDGLDGKPHAGPFVDSSATKPKKPVAEVEDIVPTSPKVTTIPDSVMDDPNRVAPKKGTTGTEGGVTEKSRDRALQEKKAGEKVEKTPDSPKEAPPLPHSEQEIIEASEKTKTTIEDETKEEKPKGATGLEKPTDLPESPHDIPYPAPPSVADGKKGTTTVPSKDTTPALPGDGEEETGVIQPFHSFVLSLTMILFSEVGDKTFLVAALMAMRHPRLVVFSAALSALIAMTVLSAVLGHAVPTLLPKRLTNFAAAILFLVFGVKMLREGFAMSPDEGVGEEMKEVEMELEEKEQNLAKSNRRRSSVSPYVLESGRARRSRSNSRLPAPARSPSTSPSRPSSPSGTSISGFMAGLTNLLSLLLSPAWVQTFVMTFLGEWGDRSQIATIAMAAGQDYWWVTGGAISGHAVCTAAAVIGGRAIAGRVSMRVVTLGGAIAFLVFGVIYLIEAAYSE